MDDVIIEGEDIIVLKSQTKILGQEAILTLMKKLIIGYDFDKKPPDISGHILNKMFIK